MARPTIPLIDRRVVIKTALETIDSQGLEAISMRGLADRVGVANASLYHHFRNKDELLKAVCSLIFMEIPVPDERTEHATEFVARTAFNTRQILLQHPNALPLMARFTPRQIVPHIYERFGNLLLKQGVPVDMISVILSAFDTLVIGSATVRLARGNTAAATPEGQPLADWEKANPRSEEEVFSLFCRSLAKGLSSAAPSSSSDRARGGPGSRSGGRQKPAKAVGDR
jgi:TetR/AcrR family tetracycline transcriptional repressor